MHYTPELSLAQTFWESVDPWVQLIESLWPLWRVHRIGKKVWSTGKYVGLTTGTTGIMHKCFPLQAPAKVTTLLGCHFRTRSILGSPKQCCAKLQPQIQAWAVSASGCYSGCLLYSHLAVTSCRYAQWKIAVTRPRGAACERGACRVSVLRNRYNSNIAGLQDPREINVTSLRVI